METLVESGRCVHGGVTGAVEAALLELAMAQAITRNHKSRMLRPEMLNNKLQVSVGSSGSEQYW